MAIRTPLIVSAKLLRRFVRLLGGHGSALPGLLIERIDRQFLRQTLSGLPHGAVIVTGTNGKTTTTHMLVQLLRDQNFRVLTNASGSNLTRGLISTVVEHTRYSGKLPYDIAVFELDEAYAPIFAAQVKPRLLVALNVMRDQLDRYGEIDVTAQYIARAAAQAGTIIVNANDALLMTKTATHQNRLTFGLAEDLQALVSSEANLYAIKSSNLASKTSKYDAKVVDIKTTESSIAYTAICAGKTIKVSLSLLGAHNALNSVVAILATKFIVPNASVQAIADRIQHFKTAFGRGETVTVHNRKMTIALIKNPSGFTQNVKTFVTRDTDAVLIVINDNYADGRDVSWLWDSHIDALKQFEGTIFVGGVRRYDMALRLKYEGISYTIINDEQSTKMMHAVMNSGSWQRHLLIIPTYTAMLAVRKWLGTQQGVKHIW